MFYSYTIQITGNPTTIESIALQSPTSDSEGEHVENAPSPTTPPTPPLDHLEKAAVVATFANIDLEEVSMHLSCSLGPLSQHMVLFTSTIATACGPVHLHHCHCMWSCSLAPLSLHMVLFTCTIVTARGPVHLHHCHCTWSCSLAVGSS